MKVSPLDGNSVIYVWADDVPTELLYYVIHYDAVHKVTVKYNRHSSNLSPAYVKQAVEHGAMLAILPPHQTISEWKPGDYKPFGALVKG